MVHESAQACVGVNRNGLEAVCELACTLVKRGVLASTPEAVTDVEPRLNSIVGSVFLTKYTSQIPRIELDSIRLKNFVGSS